MRGGALRRRQRAGAGEVDAGKAGGDRIGLGEIVGGQSCGHAIIKGTVASRAAALDQELPQAGGVAAA